MTHIRLIAIMALSASLFAGACAKRSQPVARVEPTPPPVVEQPPAPPPPPPAEAQPAAPAAALTEEEIFARKTLAELNAESPLGDAFFDLDQSALRDDARVVLQRNAEWLMRWTSTRITIEGHCDERGTSEYNLALGDRRATSASEYLVSLGVPRDRILVVSKGEESPFCAESNDGCWQQNRRGHYVITAK
jgi:peptidoglycan-associated lipoprotein